MSTKQHKPGQWFCAPIDARRGLYYRCMREVYGMTASEALAHTRRTFSVFPANGDVVSMVRAAVACANRSAA